MKTYYSIRVVRAKTEEKAIEKICNEQFNESHELCDRVMSEEEIKEYFKNK